MAKNLQPDFTISAKYGLTLKDLGKKGCANYVFNEAARDRVAELLGLMDSRCAVNQEYLIDQDQMVAYLTTAHSRIGDLPLKTPKSPLEIAASYPVLHKALVANINLQLNAGTP